jgi:hypothetical protein
MVGGFSLREAAVAAIALLLGNLRRLNISFGSMEFCCPTVFPAFLRFWKPVFSKA